MSARYFVVSLTKEAVCGHQHKSLANAEVCQRQLSKYHCVHGYVSGLKCSKCGGTAKKQDYIDMWHNSIIRTCDVDALFTNKQIEE